METASGTPDVDYDAEKNRALLDTLLEDSPAQLSEEISGLLGRTVTFSEITSSFVTEKEFFQDGPTKRVVAEMSFGTGENKLGKGYFVGSVKDSVELGGILIMLPESEIVKSIKEEDFYEDLQDAYGEIANLASGVYTRILEQGYTPAKTRVIRKGVSEVHALKSDGVLESQRYYCCSMSVTLGDKTLDNFQMLFPAVALKIFAEEKQDEKGGGEVVQEKEQIDFPLGDALARHHQKIDAILTECLSRCQQEVSALIGADVSLHNLENVVVSKADFFSEVKGKQIVARMETSGQDVSGKSFLIVGLRAAVHMGGVLIMLPPPDLEAAVKGEEYNEDIADAYGEIANIVAGAYTSTFEELHKKQLHFTRKDIVEVTPLNVDLDAAEPFPAGEYYLSKMMLQVGGVDFGRFNLLFPLDVLELQGLVYKEPEVDEEEEEAKGKEKKSWQTDAPIAEDDDLGGGADRSTEYDILLIGDDDASAGSIIQGLAALGFSAKKLSFKDEVLDFLSDRIKAVYLVMREVNEQALGMVIKISTSSSVPIIAAAPAWTRSKVIKAVKYGVRDILLTPADGDEIEENIRKNLT